MTRFVLIAFVASLLFSAGCDGDGGKIIVHDPPPPGPSDTDGPSEQPDPLRYTCSVPEREFEATLTDNQLEIENFSMQAEGDNPAVMVFEADQHHGIVGTWTLKGAKIIEHGQEVFVAVSEFDPTTTASIRHIDEKTAQIRDYRLIISSDEMRVSADYSMSVLFLSCDVAAKINVEENDDDAFNLSTKAARTTVEHKAGTKGPGVSDPGYPGCFPHGCVDTD